MSGPASGRAFVRALGPALALAAAAPHVAAHPPATGSPRPTFASEPAVQGVEERLGARLPLELRFRDHEGRTVRLGDVVRGDAPVLLVLAYYRCHTLCDLVVDGAARALGGAGLALGTEVRAVTVSIDPRDGAAEAREKRSRALAGVAAASRSTAAHRRAADGEAAPGAHARDGPVVASPEADDWPFLTGDEGAVRILADAVGFRFRYDPMTDPFAHPAVVIALTPDGKVASYLYGLRPTPDELRAALATAATGGVLSPVRRVVLRCYQYVPALRRHGALLKGALWASGLLPIAALGALLARLWRREAAG